MDAFATITPVSDAYATLPVGEAFDWTGVAPALGEGEWYLVAFRSIRRADADEQRLDEYDERAHRDAAAAPGFIHYYKGPKAADGSCISFCMWDSRSDARAAAGRPAHLDAVGLLAEMYVSYTLEFVRVTGRAGAPLRFEPYDPVPAAVEVPSAGFGLPVSGALPAT